MIRPDHPANITEKLETSEMTHNTRYATHKSTTDGKRLTLERRAIRAAKTGDMPRNTTRHAH